MIYEYDIPSIFFLRENESSRLLFTITIFIFCCLYSVMAKSLNGFVNEEIIAEFGLFVEQPIRQTLRGCQQIMVTFAV